MKILVTGGTGRIGPHVLDALLETDARLVVATPDHPPENDRLEWMQVDFMNCPADAWKRLVVGVDTVIHLAAELWDPTKMVAVNETASRLLAEAAEAAGVRRFVYSSTVGVYGFPDCSSIDEETPTLASVVEPNRHYAAEHFLLDYSLTKLRGEVVIREALKKTELVTLRFANVTSKQQIASLLKWPNVRRWWRGPRNTHQVYVGDVAAAVVYAALKLQVFSREEVFIVSEDHIQESTYADFFQLVPGLRWESVLVKTVAPGIRWLNRFKDWVKFRSLQTGLPAGDVRYLPNKLVGAGFRFRYGIRNIQRQVISESTRF